MPALEEVSVSVVKTGAVVPTVSKMIHVMNI